MSQVLAFRWGDVTPLVRATEQAHHHRFTFDALIDHIAADKACDREQALAYIHEYSSANIPGRPGLLLVGDHGVYLMSSASNQERDAHTGQYPVVYADGINPHEDPEGWYDRKVATFGGDDGVELVPLHEIQALERQYGTHGPAPDDQLWVVIDRDSFYVTPGR